LSIFKHIPIYSRYFLRIFKKYVQYAQFALGIMGKTAREPPDAQYDNLAYTIHATKTPK
jgi:hypothetical protein